MQNDTTSLPWRTSSFTSARTTNAFSVPSSAVRRLIFGMGARALSRCCERAHSNGSPAEPARRPAGRCAFAGSDVRSIRPSKRASPGEPARQVEAADEGDDVRAEQIEVVTALLDE